MPLQTSFNYCRGALFTDVPAYLHVCVPKHQRVRFLPKMPEKSDIDPNSGNLEELECLQTEYDQLYDYITQGAIIRSRATWYEMGEKNNKYFLNLENSNKTKSSVRKILTTDGALTSDPKKIMNELELYYSNLYDGRNSADTQTISSFINDLTDVPFLAEERRNVWKRCFLK